MYTFSKASLFHLLEQILDKISPDILHPHVPSILNSRAEVGVLVAKPDPNPWRAAEQIALNPQPLPPGAEIRLALGVFLARAIIDRANGQLRTALAVSGGENLERIVEVVGSQVADEVDFYCGNGRKPWPLPWPWPPKFAPGEITQADLLFAGTQFQSFANAIEGNPLHGVFSKAADKLFATAVERLESHQVE